MTLSYLYSAQLRDNFIFVNWDQRGTGYSYHEGMDGTLISQEQIQDDALELTRYLMKEFHKEKIFLLGHSFGSVIGLRLAALHPECFYAYIGMGQVIDSERSAGITCEWLHETLENAHDEAGLRRIEAAGYALPDVIDAYGGRNRRSLDLDPLMTGSPYYDARHAEQARKGLAFSQYWVTHNLEAAPSSAVDFSRFDLPLYFFEGVNDHVAACAPQLVVEFCRAVRAPKKEVVWFNDSAHMINVEEPQKFQDELIRIARENRD
jgi:pimeloyl-ACP methyl ester carboxylesterase